MILNMMINILYYFIIMYTTIYKYTLTPNFNPYGNTANTLSGARQCSTLDLQASCIVRCWRKEKGKEVQSIIAAQKWGDGIGKKMHWSFRRKCGHLPSAYSYDKWALWQYPWASYSSVACLSKFYRPHKTWNMQGAQVRGKNCCPLASLATYFFR